MKTYIIHVRDAYEREQHIKNQTEGKKNLNTSFILDGDKSDLTPEILNKYFKGSMKIVSNATSCAYKHILAYEKMIEENEDFAMILEDDISFYSSYDLLDKIIIEIKQRKLTNFMLSLEDSILRYIPRSKRKKGLYVYPHHKGRLAGAYLIDLQTAKKFLTEIEKNKMGVPVDWFHNECIKKGLVNMFWSQPPLAIQGSLDGSIESLIDNKKIGIFRKFSFKFQRFYKRLLYNLR